MPVFCIYGLFISGIIMFIAIFYSLITDNTSDNMERIIVSSYGLSMFFVFVGSIITILTHTKGI